MILQVPQSEHEVVKLLNLNSQLDYKFIVILGCFPVALLYCIELAHQRAVHGSSTVHQVQDLHDATKRAIPIIHRCFGGVAGTPLQCTQDRVSDELGGMAFPDVVVNITSPMVIGDRIV